jgi:hypothetical protein
MGNITSYFTSPSVPRRCGGFHGSGTRLSQHLQKIGPHDAQELLYQLLKGDPTARAKFILLSDGKPHDGDSDLTLTLADINDLYEECESSICIMEADDVLLGALVDAMVINSEEPGGRKLEQSVADLVWMAYTMSHGDSCFIGSRRHALPPRYLQEKFVNAIQDLDDFAKRTGYSYQIGNGFFLKEVCIRERMYCRVRHIADYSITNQYTDCFDGFRYADEKEDDEEGNSEEGDDEEKMDDDGDSDHDYY